MSIRTTGAILIAAAVVLVAGCAPGEAADGGRSTPPASDAASILPVERISAAAPVRLAEGLAPPTNRWFSSLAFSPDPLPVFPFPLAFAPDGGGFAIELPEVVASARTIAAPFTGGLRVDLGASSFTVVRYDPVSVTLEYSDADGPVAQVTIAEGSPIVGIVAARDVGLAVAGGLSEVGGGAWTTAAGGSVFGVTAPGASVHENALQLDAGRSAQVFAVPQGGDIRAWLRAIGDPVTGVESSFEVDGESTSTRLEYTGTDSTVLVPFAGHAAGGDCSLGTFATAYGDAPACATTTLEWTVPALYGRGAYDLSGLDDRARTELAGQLAADIDASAPVPADTYFGGKALAKLASMLWLARSLGDDALATAAADRLGDELMPWLEADGCESRDERCFVYDDVLRMVVGRTPSFGSEEGNDHHFHYGYFLTAAAALAEARPEMLDRLTPVMDALAADIVGGGSDGTLPVLRVFDPFRGHSWASGLSPFADGNNQESSSEAVAAWNGLALWAAASHDDALAEQATWLLSSEADAARRLWLEPDPQSLPVGYEHGIVSLSWGGKRDYATWFSPEPSAILGIQLLPFSPVSLDYLASDPERVAANVAEAGGADGFDGALGDYVLLYSALAGPDDLAAARETLAGMDSVSLDDGLTRSAALAWLAAVELRQAG